MLLKKIPREGDFFCLFFKTQDKMPPPLSFSARANEKCHVFFPPLHLSPSLDLGEPLEGPNWGAYLPFCPDAPTDAACPRNRRPGECLE